MNDMAITLQEKLLDVRQNMLQLEYAWGEAATFEERAGRPERAEIFRGCKAEIEGVRKGMSGISSAEFKSVRDARWSET